MSIPKSVTASLPSASSRRLKAGSVQARTTISAPREGCHESSVSRPRRILLTEADPVEPLLRQAIEAVPQLLGVGELATNAFDHAFFAADIVRSSPMSGRIHARYVHCV